MKNRQRDLFQTESGLGSPREPYLDEIFLRAVEELFLKETSDPRTRSTVTCPLWADPSMFSKPMTLTCECPTAHAVVKTLGKNIPRCSQSRCPVRMVLSN